MYFKKVAGSRTQDPYHKFRWVRLVIAYQQLFYENKVLSLSFYMQTLMGTDILKLHIWNQTQKFLEYPNKIWNNSFSSALSVGTMFKEPYL